MEDIKMRLQKLKGSSSEETQEVLEAKYKVNKYQQDSYKLLWQIEQTKEQLLCI